MRNGRYRFLHFGVVPHLKRVGAECVERMHFGKLQIDQLSFLHRTGRSGWLRRSLFRGRGRIFGWSLFGFRGSFNLRSLFPTSGQFVSLGRRGLAGGRLIRLGWAALAGLRRLLASGLRFFLFWRTARAGLFGSPSPAVGGSSCVFSSGSFAASSFSTSARAVCRFSFISSLILSKDTTTSPGSGWAGPSCWGVGAAACSGAGAWPVRP